ncbi:MAG: NAD(P)/FAD-dependent oxidoreductase [Actinomycetota bacterium]
MSTTTERVPIPRVTTPPDEPVVVVGAGLAGLSCATTLHAAGVPVTVVERDDGVGGRVRTDHIDGFQVDRGFQVALTAYPEMHRQLDMDALDLQPFDPGALVWRDGKGAAVSDPFRLPTSVPSTVMAPVGSLFDKARIARLRFRLQRTHPAQLLRGEDIPTRDALRDDGFSDTMIERFFRPLVGGIQLDPDLADSRRMFDVIFRMLADGDSAVPAAGMQAIPEQLAALLPAGSIRLDTAAGDVDGTSVVIADERLPASATVVATDGPAAATMLGLPEVGSKSVGSVAFAADEAPTDTRLVVLDGTGSGPVLNVAVMSNVAPTYAPSGRHLVVAAMPGLDADALGSDLEAAARDQLRSWWGSQVDSWEHLITHRIRHGQPAQATPFAPKQRVDLGDGRYVCGDHRDTASIQGAMYSGRRTALAVIERFR